MIGWLRFVTVPNGTRVLQYRTKDNWGASGDWRTVPLVMWDDLTDDDRIELDQSLSLNLRPGELFK